MSKQVIEFHCVTNLGSDKLKATNWEDARREACTLWTNTGVVRVVKKVFTIESEEVRSVNTNWNGPNARGWVPCT